MPTTGALLADENIMPGSLLDRSGPIAAAAGRPVGVVHLVLSLNVGGLEKVVYDLVRHLDRDRFSTRVVCLEEIGAWGARFEERGIPVESLACRGCKTPGRVVALARRLRELQPAILHTHNPAPHLVGAVAARIGGVPFVVNTKHGRNYPGCRKWVWANRVAAWFSDKVVPVSDDAASVAVQIEKVPARKIEVIRNGIELSRYGAERREREADRRRAIHVARLDCSSKDQRTLLRAVRIVVDAVKGFQLEIVGDGPDRADLESLCDALGLREHVAFLGFRDDVHDLLKQAEFFVLSSVTEGISLTLLEAAASGLPIVATAVGGNAEVVDAGVTGLLVPPRCPQSLADAMLELLREPQRAERMGMAGRRRIEEKFDLRSTVASYENLYAALLSRRDDAGATRRIT
jgi:sugar transferase (PEP-CTERM/EpsH1 system associated)